MQEQVKATFLVNAAVLLEFRGTKLLIDGIYDENGHCFSNLSERQWEKLKAGEGEFAGIEYLLFTHEHGDHFSPQRVAEYLEYRQPKAIFMPRDGSAALRALQKKAEGMGIPCVLLHRELCRKTVFRPEQEIRIRAFQTRHLDKLYWDVPHFCYLLECGEKKLLFTADVDFTQEDFSDPAPFALNQSKLFQFPEQFGSLVVCAAQCIHHFLHRKNDIHPSLLIQPSVFHRQPHAVQQDAVQRFGIGGQVLEFYVPE